MGKAKKKPTKRQLVFQDLKTIITKAKYFNTFMESIPEAVQACNQYWKTQTRLKRVPKDSDNMVLTAFMEVLQEMYLSLGKDEVSDYFCEYVKSLYRLLTQFRDLWIYEYKISVDFPEYKMYPILSYQVLYKRWAELNPELAEADALVKAVGIMDTAGLEHPAIDARLDELLGEGNMNLLKLPCYFYLMEKAEFVKIMNGDK